MPERRNALAKQSLAAADLVEGCGVIPAGIVELIRLQQQGVRVYQTLIRRLRFHGDAFCCRSNKSGNSDISIRGVFPEAAMVQQLIAE